MLLVYSDLHNPNIIDQLKKLFENIPSNHLSTVAILTGGAEEKFIKALKNGKLSPPIAILAHKTQIHSLLQQKSWHIYITEIYHLSCSLYQMK